MADAHEAVRPAPLSIGTSAVDAVRIVALRGEIDHRIRDHLQQALLRDGPTSAPRIVVDLSGVTFMDSTGVNVLICAHRAAVDAQGWLRLAAPPEGVLRVMQIVGLDAVIPCYPALRRALDA
ncbi:STAS domain-containing protein [Streptomyces sp. NPDC005551]|uniref:STAS domain-containing protein n=1 Tax=unclassified Streptomyces TaxID=2593676 RepID=UPI0033C50CD2